MRNADMSSSAGCGRRGGRGATAWARRLSRAGVAVFAVTCLAALGAAPAGAATLVHWWKADGDATDAVGANDGTLVGGTTFATGESGQAFGFDGNDQYVSVPDVSTHYPAGSFTVDAWAKTSVTSGGQQIAITYECGGSCPTGTDGNSFSVWEMEIRDGVAFGYVRDSDGGGPDNDGQLITGGPAIANGSFHHLVFIRDVEATKLSLYVDGSLAVQQNLDPNVAGPLENLDGEADPLTIGAQREGGTSNLIDDFTGQVDDVKFSTGADYPPAPPPSGGGGDVAAVPAAPPSAVKKKCKKHRSAVTAKKKCKKKKH